MYPSHNAQYIRTVENLRVAFAAVWDEAPAISLQVSDTEFTWCDVTVLSEPEKVSDSLPWTLFKDGVRELTLVRADLRETNSRSSSRSSRSSAGCAGP